MIHFYPFFHIKVCIDSIFLFTKDSSLRGTGRSSSSPNITVGLCSAPEKRLTREAKPKLSGRHGENRRQGTCCLSE